MLRVSIYLLLIGLGVSLAFRRGRPVTRTVALTVFAGNLLTALVEYSGQSAFQSLSYTYLGLDGGFALVLIGVAVWQPCWLTITVAAFQLNGFMGHIVKLLEIEIFPVSYAILLKLWAWPMALALVAAGIVPALSQELKNRDWPLGRR